jgi:hypothetical protein
MATRQQRGKPETPAPQANGTSGGGGARPAHEVRLGRVKAAIWANETEQGVRYSVTVCRLYKDQQDKWQRTDGFGRDDLLLLAKVLDRAHSWICDETRGAEVPN